MAFSNMGGGYGRARREPRPMKLAGESFPKQDIMPQSPSDITLAPSFEGGLGKSLPSVPGSKFVSGGRRGVIRFPTGSRRFSKSEVNAGHRKSRPPQHDDGWND